MAGTIINSKNKILEAAYRTILTNGVFNPKTSEISEEASVSRTSVNYHFNSKFDIIQLVNKKAVEIFIDKIKILLTPHFTLKERIIRYVDSSLEVSSRYPYLEIYVNTNDECLKIAEVLMTSMSQSMHIFSGEILVAMNEGIINKMDTDFMILNLFSIADKPYTILKYKNSDNPEEVLIANKFCQQRKDAILETIFK